MSLWQLLLINAGAVALVGLFGVLSRKNLIKILLSLNILETGVNLLVVALGWTENGEAPILSAGQTVKTLFVDPLPQALVLTAIVIAFGTTALGLAVAINYHKTHKSLDVFSFGNQMSKPDDDEVIE